MKSNVFTEIGFDADNNKFLLGVSSEFEKEDGTEYRKSGFTKMKIKDIYIRVWVLKKNFILSIVDGLVIKNKNKNKFKLVLGVGGLEKNDK